ncbi:MAG: hypothetical protein IH955_04255 [Chloroflexi bacterium]|nr:hypothetical protein [Chloroflexota bacterium]
MRLLLILTLPALVLAALACGGGTESSAPAPSPTATSLPSSTATGTPPPTSTPAPTQAPVPTPTHVPTVANEPTEGLCIPAASLGVSIGDSWTISGPVMVMGNYYGDIPEGAARQSTTFRITDINDADWVVGDSTVSVGNSRARIQVTSVFLDANDNVLKLDDQNLNRATISVAGLPPALTLDWDCHKKAWSQAGLTRGEAVGERSLSSGIIAELFFKTENIRSDQDNYSGITETVFGYDLQTGRLVLIESRSNGDFNWEGFSSEAIQELESDAAGPTTGGATSEIPGWLADLIDELEEKPATGSFRSIARYAYKGQTVYFQIPQCCDIFSNLYDAEGNIIAHPDGGITGQGDGRAPDFFEERANWRVIWTDTRVEMAGMVRVGAPIGNVEVQVLEIDPPQFNLVVESGLPNACVVSGGYRLFRIGNSISVQVTNLEPLDPDVICAQVYGVVEAVISLGSDFQAGDTYTANVNGTIVEFTGQ